VTPAERADVAATLAAACPMPDGSRIRYRCALFPVRPALPGRVLSSFWIDREDGSGTWAYRIRLDNYATLSPIFPEEIESC
jgi:hypothetical protein